MNSLELLEIANRAIATDGIAPPSEVLEMAKFCLKYTKIEDVPSAGMKLLGTLTGRITGKGPSPNTHDYND